MARRFLLFVVAGFLILWAVPQSVGAQDEVVIGIPLAITGAQAKFGEQHKNGYTLALEEILAGGGIRKGVLKGKKLTFHYEDDEGKPEKAKAVTEKLITRDKLPYYNGWICQLRGLRHCRDHSPIRYPFPVPQRSSG